MQDGNNGLQNSKGSLKKEKGKNKKLMQLIITLVTCVVFLFVYFTSIEFSFFPIVFWTYMILLTVLVVMYIIYNRGFSRKGITVDMLPDDWEEEKKLEFVVETKKRLDKSKWMLVIIIAIIFTFLFDAFGLFVLSNIF